MHVPQSGDQEFAGRIDDAGSRLLDPSVLFNCKDAPIGYGDGDVRARGRTSSVYDRCVLKNYGLGKSRGKESQESQPLQKQIISCSA